MICAPATFYSAYLASIQIRRYGVFLMRPVRYAARSLSA